MTLPNDRSRPAQAAPESSTKTTNASVGHALQRGQTPRQAAELVPLRHRLSAVYVRRDPAVRPAREPLYLPGRSPDELADKRRKRRDYILSGVRCTEAQWDLYWARLISKSRRTGGAA